MLLRMVAPRGNLAVVVDDPTAWLIQAVLGAFVTFAIGLPILVFSFVIADLTVKRQALTWYAAPLVHRHPRLFLLGVTVVGALVLWMGAVPLLNLVAFPTIFETDASFWLRIGLAALLAALAIAVGLAMHARYAYRCPGLLKPTRRCVYLGQVLPGVWICAQPVVGCRLLAGSANLPHEQPSQRDDERDAAQAHAQQGIPQSR